MTCTKTRLLKQIFSKKIVTNWSCQELSEAFGSSFCLVTNTWFFLQSKVHEKYTGLFLSVLHLYYGVQLQTAPSFMRKSGA
jgi:hypothetical protein